MALISITHLCLQGRSYFFVTYWEQGGESNALLKLSSESFLLRSAYIANLPSLQATLYPARGYSLELLDIVLFVEACILHGGVCRL